MVPVSCSAGVCGWACRPLLSSYGCLLADSPAFRPHFFATHWAFFPNAFTHSFIH